MMTLLIFMTVLVAKALAGLNDFQCYPNTTIHFTNPNNTIYTYYKAFYDLGNGTKAYCNGTADANVTNVYFDCASTTTTVTAYFSDRSLSNDDILGGNAAAYTFYCNTITTHNTSVAANLNVSIYEKDESQDPLFEISAAFYDGAGTEVTSATVGDIIYYVIKGPAEYDLKPLFCTAYGDGAGQSTVVITNGCTSDPSLMSDFVKQVKTLENHYNSTFYVFKFYDSNILTVNCTVQVCVDIACDISCPGRRKRRASDEADLTDRDIKTSSVGGRLTILDAPLGAAASVYGSFGVTVLFSLYKVFVKIMKFC